MATSRSAPVAPALLFDRLANRDPEVPWEPVPLRALNGEELRDSVLRELTDLLNTRSPFTPAQLEGRGRTTLEYGVADASPAYPGSAGGRGEVEARMQAAIAAYEPRLRDAQVAVEPVEGRPAELRAHVRAVLAAGAAPVPVEFTLFVGNAGGRPS